MIALLAMLIGPSLNAATTLAELAPSAPKTETGGFGGIPWGASPEAIEEKFGDTAERDNDSCNDAFARQALAEQGHDCFTIKVDRYVLEGIPFAASFRFDPHSGGLGAVVLTSSLKSRNLNPKAVRKVQLECQQNYERLARQIAGTFPSPVLPHQARGKPAEPFTKGSYRAWEGEGTSVILSRSFDYSEHWKHWRRADGCAVEVRYAAVPPEEVNSAE